MSTFPHIIEDEHEHACMACTESTRAQTPCCKGPCCPDCFKEWLERSETCMHCRRKLHDLPGIDLTKTRNDMIELVTEAIRDVMNDGCPICSLRNMLQESDEEKLKYNEFFGPPRSKWSL